MHSELRAQIAFRLTGLRDEGSPPPDPRTLRPALAARLRDLATLRYDFPVVMLDDPRDAAFARPLRELIDELAGAIDKGEEEEGTQASAALARLEREIRMAMACGVSGKLTQLWDAAQARVAETFDRGAGATLARARKALKADGPLVDCDAAFPRRFVMHAWEMLQKRKAERFNAEARRLVLALEGILNAEDARSPQGRSPARLREGFGSVHRDSFDFDSMSRLLQRAPARRALTDARRRRIRSLIAALESPRIFADGAHAFEADRCGPALKAFHARHAALRALARALAVARLEAAHEYDETRHGALVRRMRESALTREELAQFPDLIVCVRESELGAAERSDLLELLASGAPAKILVQCDDLVAESATHEGLAAIGAHIQSITGAAQGLSDVFVVQCAASSLPAMRNEVFEALAYDGPALFSVYSGAPPVSTALPPYLNAAAATESRVFPSFVYDPRTAQLAIPCNPQPERDWPLHLFEYEDAAHQRVRRELAFTVADFLAIDPRCAAHFQWLHGASPASVADALDGPVADDATPAVAMVDENDLLRDLAVEDWVLVQSRRTRHSWRRLQRLARGPEIVIVKEPVAEPASEPKQAPAQAAPAAAAVAAPAAAPAPEAKAPSSDEAYIETPRCTTCNECTTLNNKMFAYDGNKQAYIADINAGTYRQLVEAAESCQVSIIHPGKPRNADEPGVAELLERAQPFL